MYTIPVSFQRKRFIRADAINKLTHGDQSRAHYRTIENNANEQRSIWLSETEKRTISRADASANMEPRRDWRKGWGKIAGATCGDV